MNTTAWSAPSYQHLSESAGQGEGLGRLQAKGPYPPTLTMFWVVEEMKRRNT